MNDIIFAGKHFLTYTVSRHQHKSWELVYCTSDQGRFLFADEELCYSEGDIVVIPPDTPHENVSENGFTNIHLHVDDATLAFRAPALIRDDANQSILHLFSDAFYVYGGDPERKDMLLSAYGNLIVRYMAAYQSAVHPQNRIVEGIEQSIVQNYANANYELDEVLRSMPYSYDYLCKLFRKEVGMTPHKYLTSLRLQNAADMLCAAHENGNITEVALLSGFKNPLYFSRLFKKKYEVSPKEYYRMKMDEKNHQQPDSDSQKIILDE